MAEKKACDTKCARREETIFHFFITTVAAKWIATQSVLTSHAVFLRLVLALKRLPHCLLIGHDCAVASHANLSFVDITQNRSYCGSIILLFFIHTFACIAEALHAHSAAAKKASEKKGTSGKNEDNEHIFLDGISSPGVGGIF